MTAKQREIHRFWFGADCGDAEQVKQRAALWFAASDALDREVTMRFARDVKQAAAGGCDDWAGTPRGALALILLLDQFPRNIYRGTAQAFACDAKALQICLHLRDDDARTLHWIERVFAWMPLQHAESEEIQRLAVARFAALQSQAEEPFREIAESTCNYARLHMQIVQRFGRFPHRNRALGRETTREEAAWLAESGINFGQP